MYAKSYAPTVGKYNSGSSLSRIGSYTVSAIRNIGASITKCCGY